MKNRARESAKPPPKNRSNIMKKALLIAAAVATLALASCTSLRTPAGARNGKVWYNTLFGISIESAVCGDGIVVQQ